MAAHLLEVTDLAKQFDARRSGRGSKKISAIRDVSFVLDGGTTLGIVGESGAGKSTLARLITRLIEPDRGNICFDGIDVIALRRRQLRDLRTRIATVFQNPYRSFNPRMTMSRALMEPLLMQGAHTRTEYRHRAAEVVETVGLPVGLMSRYPYELAGGQLQRLAIARALVTKPRLIILDEPTTGLDVSVRAGIINLLREVQRNQGIAFLLISHDLWVVGLMAERIAVLKDGAIVEAGETAAVCTRPTHPYSQELMAAAPRLQTAWRHGDATATSDTSDRNEHETHVDHELRRSPETRVDRGK
jgi:ABC-type glutathione transport system ATPase component